MRIVDYRAVQQAAHLHVERVLLPIDLKKRPIKAFGLVNELANSPSKITVILLHVVTLSIAVPENRIYEELGREAERHLEHLARTYLHPAVLVTIHIRAGKPAEEILAEAKAENVDLIILPTSSSSVWRRVRSFLKRHLVSRISPAIGQAKTEVDRHAPFRLGH